MDEMIGVGIKQEQDLEEICPEENWLEILPKIVKTDLDDIVKTEGQYCMNYDEECSNNLPSENGLFLKEENAKIDIDQHEIPTHVILKCKEDYDESASKLWVKEEQGALDEKILVHQKLDLPKISSEAITDLNTEIDLDDIVVKSEDQFCLNCDENSSDDLEAKQSSEALDSEYDSGIVKNLVNKTGSGQQDVSRQAFFQENVELQIEKKKRGNRNKTSIREEKKHKCLYCDYETLNTFHLKQHVSAIHEKRNAKVYCCQQCTYKTVREVFLRVHRSRVHKKKAPLKCPGCEISLCHKVHLDNHLLKNHKSLQNLITRKIHYCKFCTYKTVFSKRLKCHITCHHKRDIAENTWPYLCTACTKGFNQKIGLNSHILSKHKENADLLKGITSKIHECTFCPYKTTKIGSFHIHMKRKHKQI